MFHSADGGAPRRRTRIWSIGWADAVPIPARRVYQWRPAGSATDRFNLSTAEIALACAHDVAIGALDSAAEAQLEKHFLPKTLDS